MANLSLVKREKEERSFSTASSVAGLGSLRSIWKARQKAIVFPRREHAAHPDVIDLHGGAISKRFGGVPKPSISQIPTQGSVLKQI